jgi:hypothetical protein
VESVDELVALLFYDTVPSNFDTFTTGIVVVIELKKMAIKTLQQQPIGIKVEIGRFSALQNSNQTRRCYAVWLI